MVHSGDAEYLESLERMGMTGHPGGLAGTKKLLRWLDIRQGERVLDLGCGTGYTATLIAENTAEVVAADLRPGMLAITGKRAEKKGVAGGIGLVAGDAQRLPFKDNTFDAAIAESVLVFCDVPRAAVELFRVLKPGGRLGFNEVTALRPVSSGKMERLTRYFGFRPAILSEDEWDVTLRDAGFTDTVAEAGPINMLDVAIFTPIQTDGLKKYLASLAKSITDPKVRRARWKKGALTDIHLLRGLGSGLYWARKPG